MSARVTTVRSASDNYTGCLVLRSPGSSDLDCPVADTSHDVDGPADDEHYGLPLQVEHK
jgi:hypothetical protein